MPALVATDIAAGVKKEIAAAIVNLDPTHEEACCHLMQVHAEQGDVAGALRIYKALWDLLDRDYGMEPSPATEELVAKIKLGAFERPPRASTLGRSRRAHRAAINGSVAKPFRRSCRRQGASQDLPRAAAFCDAWHRRRSRPSRAGFSSASRGVALCASANGAWSIVLPPLWCTRAPDSAPQYCIETTAYQAGTEINMVMVLRDDTTGIYVWSESFRLGLDNWFEAQQRIIRRIATSLNVQLSAERLMRLAGEPDVSLDIHDRWLRGQSLHFKYDPESWQRAVTIFRDAIRENPTFSPCYSSLVQMNNIEHFVHPGCLSRSRQGKSDARTREDAPFNWIRSIPGRICAVAGRM